MNVRAGESTEIKEKYIHAVTIELFLVYSVSIFVGCCPGPFFIIVSLTIRLQLRANMKFDELLK